jgi:hypothetical protein
MNAPVVPAGAASLELKYKKQCPGMAQGRTVNVSSLMEQLTLVDEAGEARIVQLDPARIGALVSVLRKAGLDALSSAAGASKQPCTIKLHAVIDGAVKDIEESPSMAVNDAAAWRDVQKAIEDFASGK